MSNWCENTLLLHGEADAIDAFVEQAEDERQFLSFQQIVPVPDEISKLSFDPYVVWGR